MLSVLLYYKLVVAHGCLMDCASLVNWSRQVCCQHCSCLCADQQRGGVDEGGAMCPTYTVVKYQIDVMLSVCWCSKDLAVLKQQQWYTETCA